MSEVMIGRHGVQDQVQGVGIVQNNSSPGVAGSEQNHDWQTRCSGSGQGVGIVQNNSSPGVAGSEQNHDWQTRCSGSGPRSWHSSE